MQEQITQLQKEVEHLRQIVNKTGMEVFNGHVKIRGRLKLINLTADPTQGDVGDVICVGGKLKICTTGSLTAPTYTIVGTQT